MIPLDKLRAITHVVVHGPACPDGISSALILKDALPDVRVSFLSYETAEHKALAAEPGLLFCDFSPPRDRVQEFVAAGAICLDHHLTAKDVVEAFGENGVFGLNDKNECGAWLAYEHVWKRFADEYDLSDDLGRAQVRCFAELAAVRDTWKTADPRWRQACEQAEMLLFFPFEEQKLGRMVNGDDYLLVGHWLVEKKLAAARKSIGEAHHFITLKGTRVLVFQGVVATSDAAELVERKGSAGSSHPEAIRPTDIVVGFHYGVDSGKLKLQFSMRSHTGYDVGAFAKHHGGGGHKAAAGFTVEVSPEMSANPYQLFRLLLEEGEGR